MTRLMAMALVLGVMVGLLSLPMGLAEATTVTGEVVDLTGVNDLNATADAQARTGLGKMLGYGGLLATAALFFSGYPGGAAYAGAGTGVWIFSSRIINTGMDAAQSAPVGETVYRLSYGLEAVLGFLGQRSVQDPVFYVALVLSVLLLTQVRTRERQRLAL